MITGDIIVLRPAAQNVAPGVALPAGPQGLPGQNGLPGAAGNPGANGLPGVIQSIGGLSQAAISLSDLTGILTALFDALPVLPADPSAYPTAGGLFRDGDANGYRLVRILPAS